MGPFHPVKATIRYQPIYVHLISHNLHASLSRLPLYLLFTLIVCTFSA